MTCAYSHPFSALLAQPIQAAPTANLDRTDDKVYPLVMELVKAVLHLKNQVYQLPTDEYIHLVKVRGWRGRCGVDPPHPQQSCRQNCGGCAFVGCVKEFHCAVHT